MSPHDLQLITRLPGGGHEARILSQVRYSDLEVRMRCHSAVMSWGARHDIRTLATAMLGCCVHSAAAEGRFGFACAALHMALSQFQPSMTP